MHRWNLDQRVRPKVALESIGVSAFIDVVDLLIQYTIVLLPDSPARQWRVKRTRMSSAKAWAAPASRQVGRGKGTLPGKGPLTGVGQALQGVGAKVYMQAAEPGRQGSSRTQAGPTQDVSLIMLFCNAWPEHNSYTGCRCLVLMPALHVRMARHLRQAQGAALCLAHPPHWAARAIESNDDPCSRNASQGLPPLTQSLWWSPLSGPAAGQGP